MRIAVLILLSSTLGSASTFNFSGSFLQDDDQAFFNIVVNAPASVTLSTTSFASGGFPTVLSLFGPVIDGDPVLLAFADSPSDAVLGPVGPLAAGPYLVVLTQQDNTPTGGTNLLDPGLWVDPPGTGNFTAFGGNPGPFVDPFNPNITYTGNWAVQFENVDFASQLSVPEPSTLLSLIAGLGILAGSRRRLNKHSELARHEYHNAGKEQ